MQHSQAIFELVFKRDFSDPGNKGFLENITSAYPYFSPAQFYLLHQTGENSTAFEKQAGKTNILFNNPYWLNFQLQQVNQNPGVIQEPTIEQNQAPVNNKQEEAAVEPEQVRVNNNDKPEEVVVEPEQVFVNNNDKQEETDPEPGQLSADNTDKPEEAEIEKEIEPMKIELKPFTEKNDTGEAVLFEPMHLVDYFASQGIKLTEEVQTTDKLGKQLKSFTEWLKTMKKVHVENQEQAAGQNDMIIQALAEKSNTEDEVLTESMADVFARQGKIDKAREVLEKLSLLNPAKSAYFAAKIGHLNKL